MVSSVTVKTLFLRIIVFSDLFWFYSTIGVYFSDYINYFISNYLEKPFLWFLLHLTVCSLSIFFCILDKKKSITTHTNVTTGLKPSTTSLKCNSPHERYVTTTVSFSTFFTLNNYYNNSTTYFVKHSE